MSEAVVAAAIGATIKVVLENLLSFPMDDIGLIWNFKKDLKELNQSVITIRDFLEDAETKQVIDKPLQRWLMKLEAVAFNADYLFDELNYHTLRRKVIKADNKMKKKVSSFFSTSNPTVFRRRMAKQVKDINKKLKSINQKACELGLQMRIAGSDARGARLETLAYLESDSLTMDPVFVGRDYDVRKIVGMLTSSSSPNEQVVVISVLAIVGMGGLGKTTLTRKVFNDANVISHFGERIWVHVTENFDPVIVLKKTLESLTGENVDGSREVVLRKLRAKIGDKRYLLVLDNVWNEDREKWENFITSIEGISPLKRNVIIVTTRKMNVASIVKTLDIHELAVLSRDECRFIIKAKAFGVGEGIPSEFETIGENIANKCGGLPLAAQVVGSLLRGKSKDECISIERNWLLDLGGDGNTILKILKLSFDNLPSPLVKKCFALCSIIPKRSTIEKDELIDLWMAEGFLQTHEEKDMEIVGNQVLSLLIQSSLLQVWNRDTKLFIMHDLVHDLSLSILNPKVLDVDIYQVRYMSRPHIEEYSSSIPKEDAKCLRSLLFNGKVSQIRFSNFKCLHILILMDKENKELPVEIGMLICLRYLDISHTRIESLPDSIGNLYHLQTLRATIEYGIEGCLRKLPDTFEYLINLRHLYIPNMKLPPKVGKLISLQTLPYFQVGDEDGCGIMELGSLSNLKGELEVRNLEKVRDKEEANSADLFHKPNILKLKLVWNEAREGEINDENMLEGLQPHSNLKSLEINGFKGRRFPLWILRMAVRDDLEDRLIRLDNLLEIRLSGCKECEEIPMMGHMPRLKSLYLHHLSNVKYMGSSFYGIEENEIYKETVIVFPALEKLELVDMTNLTSWAEVEFSSSSTTQPRQVSMFSRLEYLKVSNCKKLKSAPSHFPCLKELEIHNMESELPLENICGSKLTSLTKLIVQSVDGLVRLPDGLFYNNRDLVEVKIHNCNHLTHLVSCLLGGGGASLRKLLIGFCRNFLELPEDLHSLNALEELMIFECPNLKSIPYLCGGQGQSSSQGFTSLHKLKISRCTSVTNLPVQMIESCASSLERLWLRGSRSITNLPQLMRILPKMPRLIGLTIQQVPKLSEVAAEIGSLRRLVGLGIGGSSDCRDYDSFNSTLDLFFPTLQSLCHLSLVGMEHWDGLPDQLQLLTSLDELYLYEFGLLQTLPEWLGNLTSLKLLKLTNCQKLSRLPSKKAMQGLTKLTQLDILSCPLLKQSILEEATTDDSECSKISHIPNIMLDLQPFLAHAH